MGIFSKSVSDNEWTAIVRNSPLLVMLQTLTERYDKSQAIGPEGDWWEKVTATRFLLDSCPSILDELKDMPNPSSREAKKARKSLLTAIEYYINSANNGMNWMGGLMGDIGERMQYDDWMGRMAERRLDGYSNSYHHLGGLGHISLNEALTYLNMR